MLQDVVARLAAEFPGVAVTTLVVEGHPGVALVAAAEHAGLLVVGSQGHNEIAGLVLGSVSQYCATHATSSVLVHRHRAL
jgi:nucleotide-binding universal stress UspA family protein